MLWFSIIVFILDININTNSWLKWDINLIKVEWVQYDKEISKLPEMKWKGSKIQDVEILMSWLCQIWFYMSYRYLEVVMSITGADSEIFVHQELTKSDWSETGSTIINWYHVSTERCHNWRWADIIWLEHCDCNNISIRSMIKDYAYTHI